MPVKWRTHINRNIRLSETLYGEGGQFALDAIEFSLAHDRDLEFAAILEKSNAPLLNAVVESERKELVQLLDLHPAFVVPEPHVIVPALIESVQPAKEIGWF